MVYLWSELSFIIWCLGAAVLGLLFYALPQERKEAKLSVPLFLLGIIIFVAAFFGLGYAEWLILSRGYTNLTYTFAYAFPASAGCVSFVIVFCTTYQDTFPVWFKSLAKHYTKLLKKATK
ncbi:MAG: hypothetical protein A2550_05595 [Candidatus Jacksonbacteria bacterium RIFOXYD2_FULL_43_21]|nr:MAG: hypothetical protein A2240_00590 [Candidatus Jacksonbacteria bacterium RIFOXYA2_FULL_43_12]OGY79983.1 MAG: hypothetical protein A2550_05595 [Candidatus Jacksonbacteria bacterium RIFOXYD2_FULL_43_21]